MEEAKLKIFTMLLFFCLCNTGEARRCSLKDLAIIQTTGHEERAGYKKFHVELENRCNNCTQSNVKLWCPGFSPSIRVNPAGVVRPDAGGENCTLNGGGLMRSGGAVKFRYKWSHMFSFAPLSSTIACS